MRLGNGSRAASGCVMFGELSCCGVPAVSGDSDALGVVTLGAFSQVLQAIPGFGESEIFRGLYDLRNFLFRKEILLLPSIMTLYWR